MTTPKNAGPKGAGEAAALNAVASADSPVPPGPKRPEALDSRVAMELLYERAAPRLSRDELRWLVNATSKGAERACQAARSTEFIAEMLRYGDESFRAVGLLDSARPMADLLSLLSGVFDEVAGLAYVGENAEWALQDRGNEP